MGAEPPRSRDRILSRAERLLAAVLGLVWLGAGCAGIFLGVTSSRWTFVAIAALAVCYGLVWFRVAARARLLKSTVDLLMPWRYWK